MAFSFFKKPNDSVHDLINAFIQQHFGYKPKDLTLFKQAVTHKSLHIANNERLEYLGDAILDALVAHHLFDDYPEEAEGFLTKMRAKLVNRSALNTLAEKMGVRQIINSKLRNTDLTDDVLGNTLEAIVAAVYIQKGFEFTKKRFVELLKEHVDLNTLPTQVSDFKSKLFEWSQKNKKLLEFNSKEIETPENDSLFLTTVSLEGKTIANQTGDSKKRSEQKAAKEALAKIGLSV